MCSLRLSLAFLYSFLTASLLNFAKLKFDLPKYPVTRYYTPSELPHTTSETTSLNSNRPLKNSVNSRLISIFFSFSLLIMIFSMKNPSYTYPIFQGLSGGLMRYHHQRGSFSILCQALFFMRFLQSTVDAVYTNVSCESFFHLCSFLEKLQ